LQAEALGRLPSRASQPSTAARIMMIAKPTPDAPSRAAAWRQIASSATRIGGGRPSATARIE
jgi:hypothetical protein